MVFDAHERRAGGVSAACGGATAREQRLFEKKGDPTQTVCEGCRQVRMHTRGRCLDLIACAMVACAIAFVFFVTKKCCLFFFSSPQPQRRVVCEIFA